jgi:glutathione S-transferase
MAGPARALTPRHGPERRHVLQAVYLAAGIAEKVVQLFLERLNHADKAICKGLGEAPALADQHQP